MTPWSKTGTLNVELQENYQELEKQFSSIKFLKHRIKTANKNTKKLLLEPQIVVQRQQ